VGATGPNCSGVLISPATGQGIGPLDFALLAQQPNKRFATVEELGALSVFLASDAAGSITGIALPVDGGWTAH
jgi:NAD(P)-dependent dehydrogenase (short-subunit alcohol dehydrogenase family)